MLSQLLKTHGLTDKEIAVFTYLLEYGEQPASVIARKSRLSRSTCYQALDNLMSKGFIGQINRKGLAFFLPNDLSVLLDQIKNQKALEINQIQRLKQSWQQQMTASTSFESAKSRAHYFSGEEGMTTLIQKVLSTRPAYMRVCLSRHSFIQHKQGGLLNNCQSVLKVLSASPHSVLPGQAICKTLPSIFDLGIDVITTSNQVVIICLPEQFGLLIDSSLIATAQSKLFDFVWKISKPIFKSSVSKPGRLDL